MSEQQPPQKAPERQYCMRCGAAAPVEAQACPGCGLRFAGQQRAWLGPSALSTVLSEFQDLRRSGVLGESCFAGLRDVYETRLAAVRAAAFGPARERRASQPAAVAAVPPAQSPAQAEPAAPAPASGPSFSLQQWTAARQADLLLYAGSFLLSIAALIFVGYQGAELSGPGRFAVLLTYTAGFLGLGLSLPRWHRVREAARVFLGLGALLVPVNFIALRTQLFAAGHAPDRLIFLLGAVSTAALYSALAVRGFGRLYAAGAVAAALVAWGALGASVFLPPSWFGAWFMGAALLLRLAAVLRERRPEAPALAVLSAAVALPALLTAYLPALFNADRGVSVEIYVAWALATLALAAGLRTPRGRFLTLSALPIAAAMTAYSFLHAAFALQPGWLPAFAGATGLGYVLLSRLDLEVRARNWEVAALASGMLSLYAGIALAATGAEPRAVVPAVAGIVLVGVLSLRSAFARIETLAVLPPLVMLAAAGALWALGHEVHAWSGAWGAAVALGYLGVAEIDAARRAPWRLTAGLAALVAGALGFAAVMDGAPSATLPFAFALLSAGAAWESLRGRNAAFATLPCTLAITLSAVLWSRGVAPAWWVYPTLAAAAAIVACERWWSDDERFAPAGWATALLGAASLPLLFTGVYLTQPRHGLAATALGAAIVFACALRSRGALVRLFGFDSPGAVAFERQMLARVSALLLFAAAVHLNVVLGFQGLERARVFVILALSAWLALAMFGNRLAELFGLLAPIAVSATVVAALLSNGDAGQTALVLSLSAAGSAGAFPATRRSSLWLLAALGLAAALPFAWRRQGLPTADLPLAYAAAGALLAVLLSGWRTYRSDPPAVVAAILTWAPLVVSVSLAIGLVENRLVLLNGSGSIAGTREWAVLTAVLAATGLTIVLEGLRLQRSAVWACGSSAVLLAVLCGTAITEPGNPQAYTLIAGAFLLGLAFALQLRGRLSADWLYLPEALQIAGLLTLTLPPAVQSFGPGGSVEGLELLAMGLLFLVGGVAASARWIAAGGVLTLTGVALRWLAEFSGKAPFWLTLGLAGMALLLVGVLLLFQRERWEQLRRGVARWWTAAARGPRDTLAGRGS